MKIGDKVIYIQELKGLPKDSIGEFISFIKDDMVSIFYPQFAPVAHRGEYKYSNYVYLHSARLKDLKFI